ncbi:kinase [Nocardiopsis sp. NPDC007018]|uniref:serine/threonine protein kinase n=1 Tax=Nocardiopsis sp. NPDC007018 TaxID=3155721 RepID=UPI0033D5F79A
MNVPPNGPTSASRPSATTPVDRDHLPAGVRPPAKGDPETVGDHRVVGRITHDAAGTVLLGLDGAGTARAVRVVPADLADAPGARARLEAGISRLAQVRSLCAAAHRAADARSTAPWLATAYTPGSTLAEHVAAHGPLTGGVLTALAAGVAETLAAGHAVGAQHLALDPGRVVMSPEGPRVVDLGIVQATGLPIHSRQWAAPEQRATASTRGPDTPEPGPGAVTGYADVYAWGALVRFAATGREPGEAGPDPEPGALPAHLAALVRRALAEAPDQRPTALELLQELTAGEEPAAAVTALLASEWTGMSVPEPSTTRTRTRARVGRPALFAGTAAVLVVALLGGWALAREAGAPAGDGGTGAKEEPGEGASQEERTGPAVAEDPEDIDAVVADAVRLALEAESFTTYTFLHTNDVGSRAQTHFRYTEEPQPAMSRTMHFGPSSAGEVSFGEDLAELVHFAPETTPVLGEGARQYFRDPGPGSDDTEEPRTVWEEHLRSLEGLTAEGARVDYQGQGTIGDADIPEELLGDVDPLERGGHHYTGAFEHQFVDVTEFEPVTMDFELWISDEGYPVRLAVVGVPDPEAMTEQGEQLTFTHQLDFLRFGLPVEVEVPDESEILAARP